MYIQLKKIVIELSLFILKQARSCIFAGSFFLLLFLSHHIHIPGLPRYDLLFLGAVLIQGMLLLTRLETKDEAKVIFLFHIIGLALEIFKTHPAIGSWSYPEQGYLKIFGVPLYSGFMYAAVGSYISQAWRIFHLRLEHYPPYRSSITICILIYLNFFTHHYIPDIRYLLTAVVLVIFWKTRVFFTVWNTERMMPLWLSFILIAFFIWIAENISTYLGAWKYPDQLVTWSIVSLHKISSWSLLVIISVIIVGDLKVFKQQKQNKKITL